MPDKLQPSSAEILNAAIDNLVDETAARHRRLEHWIAALQAAESSAVGEPDAKEHLFLVNYRVKGVTHIKAGSSAERRVALVKLLESINVLEKHVSTSTWIIRVHIGKARELKRLLTPPLVKEDFLLVAHTGTNRSHFGDAGLA